MNTSHSSTNKIRIIIGLFLIVMLAIIFPTPVHHWLADREVLGVTLDLAIVALVILFTPVTILASVMQKFDVDFDDEGSNDGSHAGNIHRVIVPPHHNA